MSSEETKECVAEATKLKTKELPKLYRVWSVIPKFEYREMYYKDVCINWCVEDRKEPVMSYEDSIKDYDPVSKYRMYPEGAVKEFFTKTEADVLKAYLLSVFNDSTVQIEEVELPVSNNSMATAWVTFGGGVDCMVIYEEPSYCLGFKVCGVFDVRNQEPIGEVETKQNNSRCLFEQMAADESRRHDQAMEDIMALKKLKDEVKLRLKIVRGNGYFEFPCDICGSANETAGPYDLALDLPEGIQLFKINRRMCNFICSDCGKKIAPELLELRDRLRDKFETSLKAENELNKLEEAIPSLVAERKKAQTKNESDRGDDIPF